MLGQSTKTDTLTLAPSTACAFEYENSTSVDTAKSRPKRHKRSSHPDHYFLVCSADNAKCKELATAFANCNVRQFGCEKTQNSKEPFQCSHYAPWLETSKILNLISNFQIIIKNKLKVGLVYLPRGTSLRTQSNRSVSQENANLQKRDIQRVQYTVRGR